MSISIRRYVDIVSGVGGATAVRQRELILRVFSGSQFANPGAVLQFSEAADVGAYFGMASPEYKRAVQYFSYVSPAISKPLRIAFAAWKIAGGDAVVIGNNDFKNLAAINLQTAGVLSVVVGDTTYTVSAIDLSAAANMAAVATAVQSAIRAANAALDDVTVTYGVTDPQRFTVTLPTTASGVNMSFGTTELATLLGITEAVGGINIQSVTAQTPLEAFVAAEQISDNFGSFAFISPFPLAQVEELAAYNASQNLKYQYHRMVLPEDAAEFSAALLSYAGTALTLGTVSDTEFPELIGPAILAATRYANRNSVTGYMYRQQPGVSSTVSSNEDADKYDALRVNYYGDTSSAGNKIAFYQRGLLMGGVTAPTDMSVYANEQWFKDRALSELLALQLALPILSADAQGVGYISNTLQAVIDEAIFNGTISTGKELTTLQKIYITDQTGDVDAWQAVASLGWVKSVVMESYVAPSGATEYKAVYQVIYAKNDQVRLIEGTHKLI